MGLCMSSLTLTMASSDTKKCVSVFVCVCVSWCDRMDSWMGVS